MGPQDLAMIQLSRFLAPRRQRIKFSSLTMSSLWFLLLVLVTDSTHGQYNSRQYSLLYGAAEAELQDDDKLECYICLKCPERFNKSSPRAQVQIDHCDNGCLTATGTVNVSDGGPTPVHSYVGRHRLCNPDYFSAPFCGVYRAKLDARTLGVDWKGDGRTFLTVDIDACSCKGTLCNDDEAAYVGPDGAHCAGARDVSAASGGLVVFWAAVTMVLALDCFHIVFSRL